MPVDPHDRRRVDYAGPLTEPAPQPDLSAALDLSKHAIFVPVHRFIDTDTFHCLRALEDLGLRVDYSKGASAIDATRSVMATGAMLEGLESFLFIDSDMLFSPEDAIRLLLSPEPVVAGIYAAKILGGAGRLNACFLDGTKTLKLGDWAEKPTKVKRIGAGFLRIKTSLLQKLVDDLNLPFCKMAQSMAYPFFGPVIVEESGGWMYLTEDYAFCHRCGLAGVDVLADTKFRLYHLGEYAFGWEEAAGNYLQRGRNLEYEIEQT